MTQLIELKLGDSFSINPLNKLHCALMCPTLFYLLCLMPDDFTRQWNSAGAQ
jgi:hypothetical protein